MWDTCSTPASSGAQGAEFRPELEIPGAPTRVLVDQIRTIDADHVHGDPVDHLTRDQLAEIEHALARYLGLVLAGED